VVECPERGIEAARPDPPSGAGSAADRHLRDAW
jgi:hypothetical protein